MAKHGGIKDSGEYFVINPASRKVTVPHAHRSIATVGDHNSEQITFVCPQILDGHDISQCASRYVTWQNVNGEVGHDELKIVQVENSTEGMLYLAWTIRSGLTVAKGIVQFSVHFEDFDDDGTTLYRWSTATCKDCDILDSVNAVLGAYEAVYVAGDTLVFADYNVVKDGVLEIKTNGLIPEGTLQINENGTYDVGKYAEVNVSVHTKDDPDFIPENIKKGVNVLGIEGAYEPIPLIKGTIETANSDTNINGLLTVHYATVKEDGTFKATFHTLSDSDSFSANFIKGSLVIFKRVFAPELSPLRVVLGATVVYESTDYSLIVVKVEGNDFHITLDDKGVITR